MEATMDRDFFDQSDIDVLCAAHRQAVEFLQKSGDGTGDPRLSESIAVDVIAIGQTAREIKFLTLANGAILRYRCDKLVAEGRAKRAAAQ
jgi:hypothetical protein